MVNILKNFERTTYCGNLTSKDVGKKVILMGWVQKIRNLGDIVFIDLRDRSGLVQIVFNISKGKDIHEKISFIHSEFIISVIGLVYYRPKNIINDNIKTGDIEVYVDELNVLSSAKSSPFSIRNDLKIFETLKMEHRYLDLKRPKMQELILIRHKIAMSIRNFLNKNGFIDIETPFLTNSTPEGARDFLVPSRLNPGKFYALPQSPQLFKQLLMMSGFDRYYQIVRCFRDEDLRADRQPEFTQIDIEMSFINREKIISLSERMIKNIFNDVFDIDCNIPFKRITYHNSIDRYGLDKPNISYGLELVDLSNIFKNSKFNLFLDIIKKGGVIKAINIKNRFTVSRSLLDKFERFVKKSNLKGLIWIKVEKDKWKSPIGKLLSNYEKLSIFEKLDGDIGDLFLLLAGEYNVVNEVLGNLRNYIADKLKMKNNLSFNFLWITEFPMFKYDKVTESYQSYHHPFTSPVEKDFDLFKKMPKKICSKAYDLVLNGYEIGGGSIRINEEHLQREVFKILNMRDREIDNKFDYLLKALSFGAPPHGGIAFGFDRLVMLLCKEKSIKKVIPFPKSLSGGCLLTGAPSIISDYQLKDLFLKLR